MFQQSLFTFFSLFFVAHREIVFVCRIFVSFEQTKKERKKKREREVPFVWSAGVYVVVLGFLSLSELK